MDTLEGYYQRLAQKYNRPLNTDEDELLRQKALDMYDDAPYGNTMKPVKMKHKASEYVYGGIRENIDKTAQLTALASQDPSMDDRISAYTNQYVAQAANDRAWQPGKDLYALGQDAYLMEMGRAGLLKGVRSTYQKARR
jgi:hypothetical protein